MWAFDYSTLSTTFRMQSNITRTQWWLIYGAPAKPLILLYPHQDSDISVKLHYAEGFSASFPRYDDLIHWWSIHAHPDGTLEDNNTHQETYGLFWEWYPTQTQWDLSEGCVVKGSDIREFLYGKLTELGLNTKERSDFITFWYPRLQNYRYLQITFAGKEYTDMAQLEIVPHPESLLRVFMIAQPLEYKKIIPPQNIQKFERRGFTVVEWGGAIIE